MTCACFEIVLDGRRRSGSGLSAASGQKEVGLRRHEIGQRRGGRRNELTSGQQGPAASGWAAPRAGLVSRL